MTNLRIRRFDARNLVIEERNGQAWRVVGYWGSAWGVANALVDMTADTPDGDRLADQIDGLMALVDERTERICKVLESLLERDPDAVIELDVSGDAI